MSKKHTPDTHTQSHHETQDPEKLREIIRQGRKRHGLADRQLPEDMSRERFLAELDEILEVARLELDKRDASYTAKMEMVLRKLESETPDPKSDS